MFSRISLGFRVMDEAFLFGAGSLGTALLHDHGLRQFGLKIVAAFDINPEVIGKEIEGVTIHHLDDFAKIKTDNVLVGILTVPVEAAQNTAEQMVQGGIRAIWNFTPVRIGSTMKWWFKIRRCMRIWL
jgi:redox-sensing transcriptional repressor